MGYKSGNHYVLFEKETTFGTPVSATKDLGLVQSAPHNIGKTLTKTFGMSSSAVQKVVQGKEEHTGSVDVLFQHGRILELLFGSVAHDATNTPDIKHTFSFAEALPFFTLENGYDSTTDVTAAQTSATVTSATISVPSVDEPITVSIDTIAEDTVTGTTAKTAVISTLDCLTGGQASFKIAGVAATEVQNCEFNINRNTEAIYGIGNANPQGISSKEFSIDFSATLGFKDKAELDRILAATEFLVELDVTNGVAAGSGLRQLNLQLSNCMYESSNVSGGIGDFVFVDISGTGVFSTAFNYDTLTTGTF